MMMIRDLRSEKTVDCSLKCYLYYQKNNNQVKKKETFEKSKKSPLCSAFPTELFFILVAKKIILIIFIHDLCF